VPERGAGLDARSQRVDRIAGPPGPWLRGLLPAADRPADEFGQHRLLVREVEVEAGPDTPAAAMMSATT
jgi:hypothetical protein